jgi:hypothetical protein
VRSERLALYTTVYRGVEPFLKPWYQSVQAQTDREFDLWISADRVTPESVATAVGETPEARWIPAASGSTPSELRSEALRHLVALYPGVIFVDSDDVLRPSRVAAARAALRTHDVSACALEIIDVHGDELGVIFRPSRGEDLGELLPRHNVFGLSNSTYRSDLLRRCLPVPPHCILMDWLLVTRAWAAGAALAFDPSPRMGYRQYSANMARVLPPFVADAVLIATQRVLNHYACVLDPSWPLPPTKRQRLVEAQRRVVAFHDAMSVTPPLLDRYVAGLNRLTPSYVWWWCVAHPALEDLWRN